MEILYCYLNGVLYSTFISFLSPRSRSEELKELWVQTAAKTQHGMTCNAVPTANRASHICVCIIYSMDE